MSAQIDVIVVPTDGAWFEGHFPGRPILPAVAQIQLMLDALGRQGGRRPLLQGIPFLRLRQLVNPGDRLEFSAQPLASGRVRVELKRQSSTVTNGELTLGDPLPSREAELAHDLLRTPTKVPPLDDLLPHRPPMRLLTAVIGENDRGLVCQAGVSTACALARDGSASPLAAVEAAAQAAAAWEALRRFNAGGTAEPRVGYIVALREIVFHTARIAVDERFVVSAQLEAAAAPLTHYAIEATTARSILMRGTVATFLAGQPASV